MRGVFSSLVACSLLIHAALGCCWHHPHEEGCDDAGSVLQTVAECSRHDADHAVTGQSHHSEQVPCKGHSNCQGACHYLPGQKSQVDQHSPWTSFEFAAIIPATGDLEIASVHNIEQLHEAAAQLPLRLHLFHQILLI